MLCLRNAHTRKLCSQQRLPLRTRRSFAKCLWCTAQTRKMLNHIYRLGCRRRRQQCARVQGHGEAVAQAQGIGSSGPAAWILPRRRQTLAGVPPESTFSGFRIHSELVPVLLQARQEDCYTLTPFIRSLSAHSPVLCNSDRHKVCWAPEGQKV